MHEKLNLRHSADVYTYILYRQSFNLLDAQTKQKMSEKSLQKILDSENFISMIPFQLKLNNSIDENNV